MPWQGARRIGETIAGAEQLCPVIKRPSLGTRWAALGMGDERSDFPQRRWRCGRGRMKQWGVDKLAHHLRRVSATGVQQPGVKNGQRYFGWECLAARWPVAGGMGDILGSPAVEDEVSNLCLHHGFDAGIAPPIFRLLQLMGGL